MKKPTKDLLLQSPEGQSHREAKTKRGIKERLTEKIMGKVLGMSGLPPEAIEKMQKGEAVDPLDIVRSMLPMKIPLDIHITEAEEGNLKGIAIILIPHPESKGTREKTE